MKKYKVCVYAISKNEEKFAKRWLNSMKEADQIFVLDTGSTDNTVKILKENNVIVKQEIINPWRFDVARNKSLTLVPKDYDICICTDLDEVFIKGWRKKLEKLWSKNTNRLKYIYNWSLDKNNNPIISFYGEKIHSRNNYIWVNPVHEILKYQDNNESIVKTDDIIINHYPDSTKSRSSYLPLLEISVKENPDNDRNMHYLGREYMYYKRYNEAIDTLIKHLNLKSATWKDERCASMRFIARCYKNLNRYEEAKLWYKKAINEAPYLRDSYIEFALLEYEKKNWINVSKLCNKALKIKKCKKSYINEPFSWNNTVYDLKSISEYYKGNYKLALTYINKALKYEPSNTRLINNKKLIKEKIKQEIL